MKARECRTLLKWLCMNKKLLVMLGISVVAACGIGAMVTLHNPTPISSTPASTVLEPVDDVSIRVAEPAYPAQIVFGGDFATGQGCAGHKSGGCDLFSADINFSGEVANVTRLTTMGGPDVFPAFSFDGATTYGTHYRSSSSGDIIWAAVDGSSTGTLIKNAIGAAPLPNGTSIVYTSSIGSKISMADFVSPTEVSNEREVSADGDYHEPHASSINSLVVMHRLFSAGRGSNTAQPVIFNPATSEIIALTTSNGSAHCFWDGEGLAAYCNNSEQFHGMFKIPLDGSGEDQPLTGVKAPNLQQMSEMDVDFVACKGVSYAYAAFCDVSHLIVTVGCALETNGVVDTTMSKLALLDISVTPPTVLPLGKNLEEAFGGPGISSHTVACRMK